MERGGGVAAKLQLGAKSPEAGLTAPLHGPGQEGLRGGLAPHLGEQEWAWHRATERGVPHNLSAELQVLENSPFSLLGPLPCLALPANNAHP